jgi:hypothetical protein
MFTYCQMPNHILYITFVFILRKCQHIHKKKEAVARSQCTSRVHHRRIFSR